MPTLNGYNAFGFFSITSHTYSELLVQEEPLSQPDIGKLDRTIQLQRNHEKCRCVMLRLEKFQKTFLERVTIANLV